MTAGVRFYRWVSSTRAGKRKTSKLWKISFADDDLAVLGVKELSAV